MRRLVMAEPVALTALALDAAFGWPGALYRRVGHPVGLFARIIAGCEARWNRAASGFARRRALGVLTLVLLLLVAGGLGLGLQHLLLSTLSGWGWIGVAIQPVNEELASGLGLEEARGVVVADVTEGSPADQAGIEVGDVMLEFADRTITDQVRLPRIVADTEIGSTVPVTVWRDGKEQTLEITVGDKAPYTATHAQVISRIAVAGFQPGATVPVRVDPVDERSLIIG